MKNIYMTIVLILLIPILIGCFFSKTPAGYFLIGFALIGIAIIDVIIVYEQFKEWRKNIVKR